MQLLDEFPFYFLPHTYRYWQSVLPTPVEYCVLTARRRSNRIWCESMRLFENLSEKSSEQ